LRLALRVWLVWIRASVEQQLDRFCAAILSGTVNCRLVGLVDVRVPLEH